MLNTPDNQLTLLIDSATDLLENLIPAIQIMFACITVFITTFIVTTGLIEFGVASLIITFPFSCILLAAIESTND